MYRFTNLTFGEKEKEKRKHSLISSRVEKGEDAGCRGGGKGGGGF